MANYSPLQIANYPLIQMANCPPLAVTRWACILATTTLGTQVCVGCHKDWCVVLHYFGVCCSGVAVCCSVLQCVGCDYVCISESRVSASKYSRYYNIFACLWYIIVFGSLQNTSIWESPKYPPKYPLQHSYFGVCCSGVAVCCSVLQCVGCDYVCILESPKNPPKYPLQHSRILEARG